MDPSAPEARAGAGTPAAPAPATAAPAPAATAPPAMRVSDQERDAVAQILQAAFAEGRLDDGEFDERMRAALTARTAADLDTLTADLPSGPPRPAAPAPSVVTGPAPGRFAVAYKNSVRRGGRWRVPGRFTCVVYKGDGRLDLRAAELTAHVTTVVAVAYKSRVDVLVPPGARIEMDGFGVSKGWSQQEELERLAPRDAPVIHIRGVAYKGTVEVSTRPPGTEAPGG